MNPRFSNQKKQALTRIEVIVVVAVIVLLVAMLLPTLVAYHDPRQHINCVSNLKQIGLACRIWEGDHDDKYPMQTSVTNGGARELIATGNVAACFQVMSNELSTTKILICPQDTKSVLATNFGSNFNNDNISYFIGMDVSNETNPKMLLVGDDNFEIDGAPIKSGLLNLSANASVVWDSTRHVLPKAHFWTPAQFVGNIGFADGSVQEVTQNGLRQALQQTGVATNRLAIP